jgi:leucyl-tRNA synthetase
VKYGFGVETCGIAFSVNRNRNFNTSRKASKSSMTLLKQIEEKWQRNWENKKAFEANPDPKKPKFFVTFPYAYMNGPLHVGHAFTASRTDAYARFKRMQGYNVLFPWAWHWTGQPLASASARVAKGDKEWMRVLREVDGVPEEQIKKLGEPINMATYYTNEGRSSAKRIGFSVDWRREFNTMMPKYQKFIVWQYENLRELGYVSRGTHPVVWCPQDLSPTGDADRQVGEGVAPEKYVLVKFRLGQETILPAATFRPETIYGVTNIWINPDATYVEARVDKENWVVSEQAAEKLVEQGRKVTIDRRLNGSEFIGKTFESPVTKRKLLILPGLFVDSNQGTGVVYSVPAHAPYDWLALRDLQQHPESLKRFDIDPEKVKEIRPIALVKVKGYGEYPALEIADQLGVKDQNDPKADEATKLLYKKEFHSGVLRENCQEYSGKTVREVKDKLISDFRTQGIVDSMYDLPQRVVCRCGTQCIVKILQDQWFLNYSDADWKKQARKALELMSIYPETARQWFSTVIDWLREWACARTTGFGTPLPWGKGWIIETLSDSTIYMAFYTINRYIREDNLQPEALTKEFFDYVFCGKGKPDDVSKKTGIEKRLLERMREEFLYWYPVDLRVSAKELVPNHLTFFIFHHTALFPLKHWPKAIGVNGMLMIEGKQMHKSKGNFVTMKNAVEQFGADATRCTLLLAAEGMDDPDWRSENARDIQSKLEALHAFVEEITIGKGDGNGHLEKWLMSILQHRIHQVTSSLEEMKTRTAIQTALFETWNDLRWYLRRKGTTSETGAPKEAVRAWLKLLAPFAPHLAEELWSKMGERDFIALSHWPETDEKHFDPEAEEQEDMIRDTIEDTLNVLRATKATPKKVYYYTASAWKWKIYRRIVEKFASGEAQTHDVMKEFASDPEFKQHMKQIAGMVQKIEKNMGHVSQERRDRVIEAGELDEKAVLSDAINFLSERLNAEIVVCDEEDKKCYDPKRRATSAMPGRPAIYVE